MYRFGIVEQNPRVGLLSGRRALARLLLDEIGDRLDLRVDLFVEPAVNFERRVQPHRADGDAVVGGTLDDLARGKGRLRRQQSKPRNYEDTNQEWGPHYTRRSST